MNFRLQEKLFDTIADRSLKFVAEKYIGADIKKLFDKLDQTLLLCLVRINNNNNISDLSLIKPLLKFIELDFIECPNVKVEKLINYLQHLSLTIDNEKIIIPETKIRIKANILKITPSLFNLEKELKSKKTIELIIMNMDPNMFRILTGIALGATIASYIANNT